jgi:hypothetical protein
MKKQFILLLFLINFLNVSKGQVYPHVLTVGSLDSAPAFFYMDTNIPANDWAAPQIHITGYIYSNAANRAMKITLGWYYYAGNFYWTQYQSDFGYNKPASIRLGKYTKNGADYIRIEIANNSVYWSNYTVSATDRANFANFYSGWTYTEGEMPAATTSQITVVNQPASVSIEANLGIGTTDTRGHKLAVNGSIRAKEIKVEASPWPDYVFKPTYQLPSLQEIEQFIKINNHLPEIPSASEVEKEGINLGEMNSKLLKKIEELTLYLIEQKKEIQQLKRQVESIESYKDRIK